jgi:hypothetical protein
MLRHVAMVMLQLLGYLTTATSITFGYSGLWIPQETCEELRMVNLLSEARLARCRRGYSKGTSGPLTSCLGRPTGATATRAVSTLRWLLTP